MEDGIWENAMKILITGEDQPAVWLEVPPNTKSICIMTAPVGYTVAGGIGVGVHAFTKEGETKYLKMDEDFVVMDGLKTIAQGRCELSAEE